jgi:hypothetical protein
MKALLLIGTMTLGITHEVLLVQLPLMMMLYPKNSAGCLVL